MKTSLLRYSKTALLVWASSILLFSSCKKDDNELETTEPVIESTAGVYVLCEGTFPAMSSEISYYNIKTGVVEANYYTKVNGKGLGLAANDLQRYGNKMYCVVTGDASVKESFVDVMDVSTAKTIKRISFNFDKAGLPRSIAFYKNKAYVSRYDGKVSRIDTASLNIDGDVILNTGLEGLAIANGKLYVANSDDYRFDKKNVVSVIDLTTFTKTKEIAVTINPINVSASLNGDIYVSSAGVYGGTPGALERISSVTDSKISSTANFGYGSTVEFSSTKGYASTSDGTIKELNMNTGAIGGSFITDGTPIAALNGFNIDGFTNNVYVADALNYVRNGKVTCFNNIGVSKFEFNTAISPKRIVFTYNYKKQ